MTSIQKLQFNNYEMAISALKSSTREKAYDLFTLEKSYEEYESAYGFVKSFLSFLKKWPLAVHFCSKTVRLDRCKRYIRKVSMHFT